MIPKKIFYCWFGGNKPQKVLECINNWKQMLPDYEIIEINETNKDLFDVEKECQSNLWFKTCYENKMWAYVADYARLKVLYKQGGVYFDTDITVEKDITELLEKNKLVLGLEDNKSIAFGVCISSKNNILLYECLNFYNEEIWESKLYTIPQITTYVLRKHYKLNPSNKIIENDDILLLPPEYFYPIPIGLKEKHNFVTDKTYTIHWWDASWTKSNIDYFMRNKHKMKLNKLINMCFNCKIIVDNRFLRIEKLFNKFFIEIDFYYLFRFKYKYYKRDCFLVLYLFGIIIKLVKVKR